MKLDHDFIDDLKAASSKTATLCGSITVKETNPETAIILPPIEK